jgi:hypothetical protein
MIYAELIAAKNDFNKLFERSMEDIQGFFADEQFEEYDEIVIMEHFEFLYELEYKYSMLRDRNFSGVERRRENIMNLIERKFMDVSVPIIKSFMEVFNEWLETHAILSPRTWAEKRVEEMYESEGTGMAFESLVDEYNRYTKGNGLEDIFQEAFNQIENDIKALPELGKYIEMYWEDSKAMLIDEMEDDFEDFVDRYGDLYKGDTEEDIRDEIEDKAWQEAWNVQIDAYSVAEMLSIDDNIANSLETLGLDMKELLIELNEKVVFPVWYSYWKGQGIDKTRDNIEKLYKQLKSFKRYDVGKRFMLINLAKDSVHQTGSMMDYYESRFGVGQYQLDELSNMDIRDWDKELMEIGVEM